MQAKPVPMQVTIKIDGKNMTREDIRNFIKLVRDWELRTPKGEIQGIKIQTDPHLSTDEVKAIFKGVFQEFKDLVEVPITELGHLRLGRRAICLDGSPIGICQEMELTIGASTDEVNKQLLEAPVIELIKVREREPDLADKMLETLRKEDPAK